MASQVLLYLLLIAVLSKIANGEYKYTVCSNKASECEQLARSNEVSCTKHRNTASCILNIENQNTTFGTISGEEAFLAAELTKNLVVLGAFIPELRLGETADLETVVLVRHSQLDGFRSLKGLKFCHPGFKFDYQQMTPYILKEFELKALRENSIDVCHKDINSLRENYIKALSEFFGPSCRQGPWSQNNTFDQILQRRYPSLTELCNITAYNDDRDNQFLQSFNCLASGAGNITLTTQDIFIKHKDSLVGDDVVFLLPDGTSAPLDCTNCSWTRKPFHLLVTHQNHQTDLLEDIKLWFNEYLFVPMEPYDQRKEINVMPFLKDISFPDSSNYRFNFSNSPPSLQDYMKDFRTIPNFDENKLCKKSMTWCTTSNEELEKCLWFKQSILNYAIQPLLDCTRKDSTHECVAAIQTESADIVTIKSDHGYPAKRKNLTTVAFPETEKQHLIRSVIVVKPDITRLENLKGKKGCFSEYGGIAWLSFIDVARNKILPADSCDYGKLISDFVGPSCMPGARDPNHGRTDNVDIEKVCELCQSHVILSPTEKNCNANDENLFYGSKGALECLSTTGQFAVVTLTEGLTTNFTVLCKNNTLANRPGLDVDDDCFLSITIASEVVTRRGDSLNDDIKLALLEIDEYFAVNTRAPFKVFEEFHGNKDLLFLDSTNGLDSLDSKNTYINNYRNLFKHIDECVAEGKSNSGSGLKNTLAVSYTIYLSVIWFVLFSIH